MRSIGNTMEYSKEHIQELRKRKLTVFEDIHQLKIELSKGCNRKCDFCGIATSCHGRMNEETFRNTIAGAPNTVKRVEFILHGEPTLNENIYLYSELAREKFPLSQITVLSNTEIYRKKGIEKFIALWDSGVTLVQADLYDKEHALWFLAEIEKNLGEFEKRGIKIFDYYKDRINPFHFRGPRKKMLILTKEYEGLNNQYICTRDFHNFGGNLPYRKWKDYSDLTYQDLPMEKICTEPLKYISVWYNGDITLCCRDGGMGVVLGNVNQDNLTEVWQGKDFQVLRNILYNGHRSWVLPCILCNIRSFRIGLYPYWGRKYSKEEVLETLEKIHRLNKKEALYDNLIEFSKIKELEPHIKKLF